MAFSFWIFSTSVLFVHWCLRWKFQFCCLLLYLHCFLSCFISFDLLEISYVRHFSLIIWLWLSLRRTWVHMILQMPWECYRCTLFCIPLALAILVVKFWSMGLVSMYYEYIIFSNEQGWWSTGSFRLNVSAKNFLSLCIKFRVNLILDIGAKVMQSQMIYWICNNLRWYIELAIISNINVTFADGKHNGSKLSLLS